MPRVSKPPPLERTGKPRVRRRIVRLATGEPDGLQSQPRLFAFGFRSVAQAAGKDVRTVRRAIASGQLDIEDLSAVVQWITHGQEKRPCKRNDQIETAALAALTLHR